MKQDIDFYWLRYQIFTNSDLYKSSNNKNSEMIQSHKFKITKILAVGCRTSLPLEIKDFMLSNILPWLRFLLVLAASVGDDTYYLWPSAIMTFNFLHALRYAYASDRLCIYRT